MIVGSRLQALIYGFGGLAVAIGGSGPMGALAIIPALVLGVLAVVTGVRRVELSPSAVLARNVLGTRRAERSEVDATVGHRYLVIRFPDGHRARIEVPVEIRPDVREWAATDGDAQ